MVTKGSILYEGKAKKVYSLQNNNHDNQCVLEFKDDLTAFDGNLKDSRDGKGILNNKISSQLLNYLENQGVSTHFIKCLSDREMLVTKTKIIPIEVVVRNIVAGSLVNRLGLEKGTELAYPVVEFYYKEDKLKDPLINEHHAIAINLATSYQLKEMSNLALRINQLLKQYFYDLNLILVDFKLEFGRVSGEIILSDEITPDTCRLWDKLTKESLDKDNFRENKRDVLAGYEELYQRIQRRLEKDV
ncbi:phosphoribosylaminoimidazolesuccinocarboxamide synthase [Natranaerobius trueperi]|uniref:Phosphoribosylaminoimidazole-succinocarboxamide synthase n=1 Tax=Natranaerobius trueperi TaxID=759412 RepID=A0A226C2A7_9FIRM|nr:phosphoribosylaminoimidazolesuccinocarboxamide synthase [Natranaerobius trueperi]OWZ84744.1 phosphoribosylaminoimidazolesuccinocarboxamide synthase [Natranaerobius trueperi]